MASDDWARERAREIIGFRDKAPCDCIENAPEGMFYHRCDCKNSGDLERISVWCHERNLLTHITTALREAEQRALGRAADYVAQRGSYADEHLAAEIRALALEQDRGQE